MKTIVQCQIEIWEATREDLIRSMKHCVSHDRDSYRDRIQKAEEVIIALTAYHESCKMGRMMRNAV